MRDRHDPRIDGIVAAAFDYLGNHNRPNGADTVI
jgi:hypothetical protein